uniref:NADH dehydrogenase subunit 6 n=1 Tax=Nucula nucleus TaxID=47129 RepID=D3G6E2_9BIVA|nr:NADH dehydrogenase subunit 6 [Nucula nucleus]
MTLLLLFCLTLSTIFIMPLMLQPLSLGAWIMLIALFSSLLLGLENNSWFGYVLFLMYVGGLLIKFAYAVALAPNMIFYGFNSAKMAMMTFFTILALTLSTYTPYSKLGEPAIKFINEIFESISGLLIVAYNTSIFIGLSIILFIALIAVVKVCYFQEGPLRSFKQL